MINFSKQRVGVIDYGVGNVGSIRNMLRRAGVLADIISDPEELASADRAILPGIGHFAHGMGLLQEKAWPAAIQEFVGLKARPFLGICLGMQLLARGSEEGAAKGLGMVDFDVRYFAPERMKAPLPVPHMGWASVTSQGKGTLFAGMPKESRFYFVHSLHMSVDANANANAVAGLTDYGYPFVSAIEQGNLFGVQFHPEKSHVHGMNLLDNFCRVKC